MKPLFIDTSFLIALLDRCDRWRRQALALMTRRHAFVTSELVLIEFLNAFAKGYLRPEVHQEAVSWLGDRNSLIVPLTRRLFADTLDLYGKRLDKDWSFTDCASFLIMRELGITDALTADRHFIQAGFRALLLEP